MVKFFKELANKSLFFFSFISLCFFIAHILAFFFVLLFRYNATDPLDQNCSYTLTKLHSAAK